MIRLKAIVAAIVMEGVIIFLPLVAAYAATYRPLDIGKALAEESLRQSICNTSSLQTISCNQNLFTHQFFYENFFNKSNAADVDIDPPSISAQLPENVLNRLVMENGLPPGAEYGSAPPESGKTSTPEASLGAMSATLLIFSAGLIGLIGLRRDQLVD